MIDITFVCFGTNFYEYHSSGHADYSPGNDLVCAGVSALSYALLGTLKNIDGITVQNDIRDGNMSITIEAKNKPVHAIANTVFSTILIGLKQMEATFKDHVKVTVLTEASGA